MTDYTPENRIQEKVDRLHDRSTAAEESLKFTDRKFAELVREATRLKRERDELLEALKALEPYLDAIVCYASTMDEHEPNRLAVNARAILEKVK